MSTPQPIEYPQARPEVRQVFPVAKGFVAGCLVTEGKITRNAAARVRRGKDSIFEGKVGTLRRFKDDANEVRAGLECGIRLDGFDGYQPGDRIELTGTVSTKEQRQKVREIAKSFAVHSHVVDKLTIAPRDNGTDIK